MYWRQYSKWLMVSGPERDDALLKGFATTKNRQSSFPTIFRVSEHTEGSLPIRLWWCPCLRPWRRDVFCLPSRALTPELPRLDSSQHMLEKDWSVLLYISVKFSPLSILPHNNLISLKQKRENTKRLLFCPAVDKDCMCSESPSWDFEK